MQKENLLNYNCQVDFFEDEHAYIKNDGNKLIGITGIISKMLFPNKYTGIPGHVLDKAANYGNEIHSKCQENDMFGTVDCIEIENYVKIKSQLGLEPIENEYLVSDNERIATLIDAVYTLDGLICLADIKTTSVLDKDSLSWQLSICAYLFELQNPSIKVSNLFGIWLRKDKYKHVEVERKPNSVIIDLIESYFNSSEFVNPYCQKSSVSIDKLESIDELISIDAEISILEARKKELLSIIQPEIEQNQYKDERVTISWVAPSSSIAFDSAKFKKENPELADKYKKETSKSGFLKITYKKQNENE